MKAVFLGFCTIDTIDGNTYLGGAGGASALNAAGLGIETRLISVLSSDDNGTRYEKALQDAGIDISRCIQSLQSIPTCTIVDPHGQGSTRQWVDNGALKTLDIMPLSLGPLEDADCIFLYSCHPAFQKALLEKSTLPPLAFIPGPQIITNPHYLDHQILEKVTVLFVNEEEAHAIGPYTAIKNGVSLVVVTYGKDGLMIYNNSSEPLHFGAPDVATVADTTGAGDTFALGFMTTYVQTHNIAQAVAYGNELTAKNLQKPGSTI